MIPWLALGPIMLALAFASKGKSKPSTYEERRVKVADYGVLPSSSPLLCPVPGVSGPRRVHCAVAEDLIALFAAAKAGTGVDLRVQSGWRAHRWDSREHYEQTLIKLYGSVEEGRKWLGFNSPHETGLAVDLVGGGLEVHRSTVNKQRATPIHAWMVANASRFGWHPYKKEPWHWEHVIPFEIWERGQ